MNRYKSSDRQLELVAPLLADRGYDSDAFVDFGREAGRSAVIASRKNRLLQRERDKNL